LKNIKIYRLLYMDIEKLNEKEKPIKKVKTKRRKPKVEKEKVKGPIVKFYTEDIFLYI